MFERSQLRASRHPVTVKINNKQLTLKQSVRQSLSSWSWIVTETSITSQQKCPGPRPPSQDRVRARWSKFQVRSEEWPQQPFDVAGEEMSWSARWSHLSRPGPIVAFHFTNWSKHGQNMIYKPIQYFCVIWKRWSILFSTSSPSVQSSEAPHN